MTALVGKEPLNLFHFTVHRQAPICANIHILYAFLLLLKSIDLSCSPE